MTDAREIIRIAAEDKMRFDGFPSYDEMAEHLIDALASAGFRILGPNEIDQAGRMIVCPDCDGQKLMHGHDCDCPHCAATGVVTLETAIRSILDDDDADVFEKLDDIRRALGRKA